MQVKVRHFLCPMLVSLACMNNIYEKIHIHNYCPTLNLGQSLKHVGGVCHGPFSEMFFLLLYRSHEYKQG